MSFPISVRCSLSIAMLGLVFAAPVALAQGPGGGDSHSVGSSHIKPPNNAPTLYSPYEAALRLEQLGLYDKAIELLEPEAKQGPGYEMAQLELGRCYLGIAAKAATPAVALEATKKAGAWIETAAEAGLSEAQEQMARLYIEGGHFKVEPVEAGKWYVLWKGNPRRFQAVNKPFDPKLEQKLKTTLTDAQWAQARQAAMDLARRTAPAE